MRVSGIKEGYAPDKEGFARRNVFKLSFKIGLAVKKIMIALVIPCNNRMTTYFR